MYLMVVIERKWKIFSGRRKGELMLVLRGVSSLMKDENKECLNEGDISSLTWHMLHLVQFESPRPIPSQLTGI